MANFFGLGNDKNQKDILYLIDNKIDDKPKEKKLKIDDNFIKNATMDNILSRTSIRAYSDKKIEQSKIYTILGEISTV